MDTILQSPLDYKRAWIATTSPVIQQGLRIATRLLRHNQRPITDFFPRCNRSSHTNTSADPARHDNGPSAPD